MLYVAYMVTDFDAAGLLRVRVLMEDAMRDESWFGLMRITLLDGG